MLRRVFYPTAKPGGALLSLFILILAMTPLPVKGQTVNADIISVIQDQLEALRVNDGPRAFSHAAPIIQEKFQSSDSFMSMVRKGYRILIDPISVELLDTRREDNSILQAVRVIGRKGDRRIAIYQMQQSTDNSWKIAGVYLVEDRTPAV